MRLRWLLLLAGVVFLVQACGISKPDPEEACHFQQNAYLQRVSWHATPVTLYADPSLSADHIAALEEAIELWNEAYKTLRPDKGVILRLKGPLPTAKGFNLDGINVVSITTTWNGDSDEQAETLFHWENTVIREADIRVNGTKPFSTDLVSTAADQIDMVALFVHELGHVLGLRHIESDEYTSMAERLERGDQERRQVGPIELDALKCEY